MDIIQTCGNCKYFKIIKQSREVKKIVDTSYVISKCEVKGWQTKEHYLLKTNNEITNEDLKLCEFWKHWRTKTRHKKR